MRYRNLIFPIAAITLIGCSDDTSVRWAKFQAICEAADFSARQCQLLFALREKAADEADTAAIIGAVGIGIAAGNNGQRR